MPEEITDLSPFPLDTLERQLNSRPRKRHGRLTPEEVFLKMTGVALYS